MSQGPGKGQGDYLINKLQLELGGEGETGCGRETSGRERRGKKRGKKRKRGSVTIRGDG